MKLLIITDLHTFSYKELVKIENIPEYKYDACFTLGDIDVSDLQSIKWVIKKPIYGINGNHDSFSNVEDAGIKNIHNNLIVIDNKKITAIQGSAKYKMDESVCQYDDEKSIEIAKKLPKADIFFTHDIPYSYFNKGIHKGMKGIKWYIKNNKPALHIHGHTHQNVCECFGKTTSIGIFRCSIIDVDTLEVERIF